MEQSQSAHARQALFALGTPRTPIVAHPGWKAAIERATAAIEGGRKVVAILGPGGVGKTTLLHEIAHVARQGIARPVTVLDDADQLGPALMQRVAETGNGCMLLAGRPELALELSLMGPDAAIISLGRVWQSDVPAYLDALCEQTGQAATLIGPAAMERLGAVSSGLPGVMMAVARMAALVAVALKADRVEPAHVERAAQIYAGRAALPASPADLAALLREAGPDEPAPGASAAGPPPRRKPTPAATRRSVGRRPARRAAFGAALGIAAGSAILVTGVVLWLGMNAVPTNQLTPAPPPVSVPAPEMPAPPPAAQPVPPAAPTPPAAPPQAAAPPPAPAPVPAPSASPAEPPQAAAPAPPPPQAAESGSGETGRSPAAILRTLPALAPPLVVVNYASGSLTAQARAAALAAALRANGFATTTPEPAEADPDRRGIGFFFFEDGDAATAVADAAKTAADLSLGTPGLLPLTRADRLPRPGTIKVFIAGDLKALSASHPR